MVLMVNWSIFCWLTKNSCAGRRAPAGQAGFRCTGGPHRVGRFYANWTANAEPGADRDREAILILVDGDALRPGVGRRASGVGGGGRCGWKRRGQGARVAGRFFLGGLGL